MIQRYPSNDFSLTVTDFYNCSSGSESDDDDDSEGHASLQDGFKAVDKTKDGFELAHRSLTDPDLQEKVLEMRRSRPRRATRHTTTNIISSSELHLPHKKSTASPENDSGAFCILSIFLCLGRSRRPVITGRISSIQEEIEQ